MKHIASDSSSASVSVLSAVAERRDEHDGEGGRQQAAVLAEQQEREDAQDDADAAANVGHAARMAVRRGFFARAFRGLVTARGDSDQQPRECQQRTERDREEARPHVRKLADAVADAGIDGGQSDDDQQGAAVVIF